MIGFRFDIQEKEPRKDRGKGKTQGYAKDWGSAMGKFWKTGKPGNLRAEEKRAEDIGLGVEDIGLGVEDIGLGVEDIGLGAIEGMRDEG